MDWASAWRKEEKCGKAVADARCESHGQGEAIAHGSGSEVTGAIRANVKGRPAKDSDAVVRWSD